MHTPDHTLVITDHDQQRLLSMLDSVHSPMAEQLDWELHRAKIVAQHEVPPDVVTMNSEVVYEDLKTGTQRTVRLVYPKDADSRRGWVSVLAPIGSALLGLRVGQQIEWELPTGPHQIRLIAVSYQPEARGDFHL